MVYESIFATHEQAAEAFTDVFEKRWARDRVPRDRTGAHGVERLRRLGAERRGAGNLIRI